MPDRFFPALDSLIRDVEADAAQRADMPSLLAAIICMIAQTDADPYLLIGTLIEGSAMIAAESIPKEKGEEVAMAMVIMLRDRLLQRGIVG